MHHFKIAMIFQFPFYLLAILFLLFGPAVAASPTGHNMTKKTDSSGAAAEAGPVTVPPIDQAAPTSYETATFGLG